MRRARLGRVPHSLRRGRRACNRPDRRNRSVRDGRGGVLRPAHPSDGVWRGEDVTDGRGITRRTGRGVHLFRFFRQLAVERRGGTARLPRLRADSSGRAGRGSRTHAEAPSVNGSRRPAGGGSGAAHEGLRDRRIAQWTRVAETSTCPLSPNGRRHAANRGVPSCVECGACAGRPRIALAVCRFHKSIAVATRGPCCR